MFRNRKITPFVFFLISVIYIIYVVSLGDSKMLGDEIGGDPGGMAVPLVLGIFMLILSFFIFLTDKQEGPKAKMTAIEKQLLLLTVIVAIAYVALARALGFILSTSLVLYFLLFINLREGVHKADLKAFFIGLVSSVGLLTLVYTVGRLITRNMTIAARRGNLTGLLASSGVILIITLLAVSVVLALFIIVFKQITKKKELSELTRQTYLCLLISVISTETLYLIFKQLFIVNLVGGIIGW